MAVGKNKQNIKPGKKGGKKKVIDPFTRKEWYDVKAPSMFKVRKIGKTLVNRTQGTRLASDGLKGRVYEVSLADLQNENDAERSFRKFKLICEEVQGKNCLTNFHGMGLTTDKLRSMVKKWQTLVEGNCDVKTTDGYTLRVFCIGFTRKQEMSSKKTAYAQAGQVRNIRKKMIDITSNRVGDELVHDFLEISGADLPLDDVDHLLTDVADLSSLSISRLLGGHLLLPCETDAENPECVTVCGLHIAVTLHQSLPLLHHGPQLVCSQSHPVEVCQTVLSLP